ncbi:MAG TPA: CapA family protein [Nocardioidaceae bacterium]|nr:CapA family protein [Nocardioidaceae bacterium]
MPFSRLGARTAGALLLATTVAACAGGAAESSADAERADAERADATSPPPTTTGASPTDSASDPDEITLGFAGDVHFAGELAPRLQDPDSALAPIASALRRPDLMMVNLETAITDDGAPEPKQYHFRTSPAALDALAAAGVDVATMANNHAADYGGAGLADTLAAVRRSPVPVVGIGTDVAAAFRPYVASVRGTRVAVLGATTLPDRTAQAWAAGPGEPGVAVALLPEPRLVDAVRAARAQADVVVVYLHWGGEGEACPYWRQFRHAEALAAAGADIVVGSHAHVLLDGGWLGDTYVDYGLGNFVWYSQGSLATSSTGVLTLTVRDGTVVEDSFAPARIGSDGLPRLLTGSARKQARARWQGLADCTDLAAYPPR